MPSTKARLQKRIKHQVNELLDDATDVAEAFRVAEESSGKTDDAREYFNLHINACLNQALNKNLYAVRLSKMKSRELYKMFGSYDGYYLEKIVLLEENRRIVVRMVVTCLEPDRNFLDLFNEEDDDIDDMDFTININDLSDLNDLDD